MIEPMRIAFYSVFLLTVACGSAEGQARVIVPTGPFRMHERIKAIVINEGKAPITVCTEMGQSSQIGKERQSTPYPFYIQKLTQNKWSTLLIGPDAGSYRATEILEPGEPREYPFALNDTGKMRLLIEFWPRELPGDKCPDAKGRKTAKSKLFFVREQS